MKRDLIDRGFWAFMVLAALFLLAILTGGMR